MEKNSHNLIKKENYRLSFKFEYGSLDDGSIWIRPPSSHLFHIDQLTLRIILELNGGVSLDAICKKYDLSRDEVSSLLERFEREKAIVEPREGKITRGRQREDISLTPLILLAIILGVIQIDYFKFYAQTFLMDRWQEGALIGSVALVVILFHELGHYLIAKRYFQPKFGFTFLFIFPAIYVSTQPAWCLPRNIRLLINSGGLMADLLVNTIAVVLVIGNRRLEYYITPFLLTQYTRWTILLNPLITGDGYWLLSDFIGVVNLAKKGFQNLIRLRLNLYSLFGLLSLLLMVSSTLGMAWFVFNLLWRLF